MIRKLYLTGFIVLIAPGKAFQVILVALSNVCFLTFLTVMKPHSSVDQRNLAVISDFAITFTMLLGLTLKTVEDTGDYSTLYAMLLVGVNVIVVLYALRLFALTISTAVFAKCYKPKKTAKVAISHSSTGEEKIRKRVEHFVAVEGISWPSREGFCDYLNMTEEERKKIARKGAFENDIAGFFATMEKKMKKFEHSERDHDNAMQATKVFASLASSNSGKKDAEILKSSGNMPSSGESKAEYLKVIRKKHGAQSKEYKEALVQI